MAASLPRTLNYIGDFPIDRLPHGLEHHTSPYSFIANTAPSTHRGEHWFVVVQPPPPPPSPSSLARLLVLDPLALPLDLLLEPLKEWLHGRPFTSLEQALQPSGSVGCGAFCLYILEKLPLYTYNPRDLVKREFSGVNLWSNHHRVMSWWRRRVESTEV